MNDSKRLLRSALLPALAIVAALSCKDSPTSPPTTTPGTGPLTLTFLTGLEQGGVVAMPLDTALIIAVTDTAGAPVPGVPVTVRVDSGGGAVTPTSGTTDAAGRVEVAWTLGNIAGLNGITATATDASAISATAIGYADVPDSIFTIAGDGQSELPGRRLPAALQVAAVDRFGNRVADVPITFSTNGTGVYDSTEVFTDLNGVASAWYTLGAGIGADALSATLLDSAVADIVQVAGSPLTFTATATSFAIVSFASAEARTGETLRILGTGFSPLAEENTVTIGGSASAIVEATPTELAVLVPSFGCVPATLREVAVSRDSFADTSEAQVVPAGLLALAVGEQATRAMPEDFCLQLPGSESEAEYVVGMTATRPLNASLAATLTAEDGVSAPALLATTSLRAAAGDTPVGAPAIRSADRALREWEVEFFKTRGVPPRTSASLRGAVTASAVGDLLAIRVPDITTDPCQNYTAISARVVAEGARLIIATNSTLPTGPVNDALVAAAFDSIATRVDATVLSTIDTYLGALGDRDGNGKVIVVLTPAVNGTGAVGFTSAVDLLDRTTCPSSDEGEIIYVAFPESPTLVGARTQMEEAGPALAREFAYATQLSRRLDAGQAPLAPWLSEGIAHVAAELAGLATATRSSDSNLGAAAVTDEIGNRWHRPTFDRLTQFLGWDGASGRLDGAPEGCSLFGFGGLNVPCGAGYSAGAAWSFARYIIDRAAAGLTPARIELLRGLVMTAPVGTLPDILQTVTGRTAADLIVEWAQALVVDGTVSAAAAPTLQFASWNLPDVFAGLPAAQRPALPSQGFSSFARQMRVIGGGTAYQRIGALGAHGALALRVRAEGDGLLSAEMQPRLWVVRVR